MEATYVFSPLMDEKMKESRSGFIRHRLRGREGGTELSGRIEVAREQGNENEEWVGGEVE